MYPAREILNHAALRSNSGPIDPLVVAKEVGVSAADALNWRIVAQLSVPPVMSEDGRIAIKPAGLLSILVVGDPCRGILLCIDRRECERECVRIGPDGVRFAIIEGVAHEPVVGFEASPKSVGELMAEASTPLQMMKLVERVESGGATIPSPITPEELAARESEVAYKAYCESCGVPTDQVARPIVDKAVDVSVVREAPHQHVWDKDGERCEKCGIKDWMTAAAQSSAITDKAVN